MEISCIQYRFSVAARKGSAGKHRREIGENFPQHLDFSSDWPNSATSHHVEMIQHLPLCLCLQVAATMRDGGEGGKLMLTEGSKRVTHALNTTSSVVKWVRCTIQDVKGDSVLCTSDRPTVHCQPED